MYAGVPCGSGVAQDVSACLCLSVFIAIIMVKKTSFRFERVYGFVCLLIFQVRENPDFFFADFALTYR